MGYFRTLEASEIDCRIATIKAATQNKAGGLSLLLYKDARVDQNILDEKFGPFGWQRSHQIIGDNLYCTVSVKDPDSGEWISKQDVGTESYTEKEKGQASDSFKRACFNLGIGRELYTAPFIWVTDSNFNMVFKKDGTPTTYDKFKVTSIDYDGQVISGLEIVNENTGEVVFTMNNGKSNKMTTKVSDKKAPTVKEEFPDSNDIQQIMGQVKILMKRTNINEDVIKGVYKMGLNDMNITVLKSVKKKLQASEKQEKSKK